MSYFGNKHRCPQTAQQRHSRLTALLTLPSGPHYFRVIIQHGGCANCRRLHRKPVNIKCIICLSTTATAKYLIYGEKSEMDSFISVLKDILSLAVYYPSAKHEQTDEIVCCIHPTFSIKATKYSTIHIFYVTRLFYIRLLSTLYGEKVARFGAEFDCSTEAVKTTSWWQSNYVLGAMMLCGGNWV